MRKRDLIQALNGAGCENVTVDNDRWRASIAFGVDGAAVTVTVCACERDTVEVTSLCGRAACGAWRFRGSAVTVARALVEAVRGRHGYHLLPVAGVSYAPHEDAFDELLDALPGEGVLTVDRASGDKWLHVDGYMVASAGDKVNVDGRDMHAGEALAWIKG